MYFFIILLFKIYTTYTILPLQKVNKNEKFRAVTAGNFSPLTNLIQIYEKKTTFCTIHPSTGYILSPIIIKKSVQKIFGQTDRTPNPTKKVFRISDSQTKVSDNRYRKSNIFHLNKLLLLTPFDGKVYRKPYLFLLLPDCRKVYNGWLLWFLL